MSSDNFDDVFDLDDSEFIKQYGTHEQRTQSTLYKESANLEVDSNEVESEESGIDENDNEIDSSNNADAHSGDNTDSVTNDSADDSVDDDDETEDSSDSTDEVSENINELYKKIIGSPIKGAGKEIILDNPEDAIRLIQMGLGFQKSMEQLKPHKRTIAMLEKNGIDEEKLNFLMDIANKNPQAIKKLISDSEIDLFDLDDDDNEYKPSNYRISDQELNLDQAIKDIEGTPTYARTISLLGQEWDNASRDLIQRNPEVIGMINEHIASGLYDTVNNEVEKLKTLGKLPTGLCDLEIYKYVGDALYANSNSNSAPMNGQQTGIDNANGRTPIKKPSRETVIQQKKATSVPRSQSSNSRQSSSLSMSDVWDMDDEEFTKRYGRGKSL